MFSRREKSHTKRTIERLRHHYETEKEIADRLRRSSRDHRIQIMRTMYDELFAKVPDHPRLTARHDPKHDQIMVAREMNLLRRHLRPNQTFIEFGPGNCGLAIAVCSRVARVYAVDISEQTNPSLQKPDNFNFVVYDGYSLDLPGNSIDVVFSNQMIEHLHPDDTADHFHLVHRLLKPGAVYVFCMPHKLYGPHDVSRHFSDVAQGFHLKEWTFKELVDLAKGVGFSKWLAYWYKGGICLRMPTWLILGLERMVGCLPVKIRRRLGPYLLPSVTMTVKKNSSV